MKIVTQRHTALNLFDPDFSEPQKQCLGCKNNLPLIEFRSSNNTTENDRRSRFCNACHGTLSERERQTIATRVSRQTRDGKRYLRNRQLIQAYGITLDEYERMHDQQHGLCAICQQPEKTKHKHRTASLSLAVDHNHATGKVRGLLCSWCNTTLGKMNDDPALLRAAIAYLERDG